MTSNQRKKAFNLLEDGANYQETADVVGCTREEIAEVFGKMFRDKERRAKHDGAYPAIHEWKQEHGYNNHDLALLCGVHPGTVNNYLRGSMAATKGFIDKILELTGMTYEDAFRKR